MKELRLRRKQGEGEENRVFVVCFLFHRKGLTNKILILDFAECLCTYIITEISILLAVTGKKISKKQYLTKVIMSINSFQLLILVNYI